MLVSADRFGGSTAPIGTMTISGDICTLDALRDIDEAIAGVGEIIEKSAPVAVNMRSSGYDLSRSVRSVMALFLL